MNTLSSESVFLVRGNSMLPVLKTGDRVKLRPVKRGDLRIGDIAVFTSADGNDIIHRVIRTRPLQTRGDNRLQDDPPVPQTSPLYLAVAFCGKKKQGALSSGRAGLFEFRKNQLRRRTLNLLRRILEPIARQNPFKLPFRRLTTAVFPGKTVYYAGKRPVGWHDAKGWHWMPFARFFVQAPPPEVQKSAPRRKNS